MLRRIVSKTSLLTFVFVFGLLLPTPSLCFENKGQDCSKCHTLSSNQAKELLQPAIPDIEVLNVTLSPAQGLWEVYFQSRGRKGLIYVDFAKKHFLTGSLIDIGEKRNLTQERFTELNKVDVSQIPLNDALVLGNPDARIKVISFHDPD